MATLPRSHIESSNLFDKRVNLIKKKERNYVGDIKYVRRIYAKSNHIGLYFDLVPCAKDETKTSQSINCLKSA